MSAELRHELTPAFDAEMLCEYVPTLTESTLRNWKSAGLLEPTVINLSTRGSRSLWSVREAVLLRLAARFDRRHFDSVEALLRAVDHAIPRRAEEVTLTTVFYWNGGEIHVLDPDQGAPLALDERVFIDDFFAVRENIHEQFARARSAAMLVDVGMLIENPHLLRGRVVRIRA
jgi:hypothetical protein